MLNKKSVDDINVKGKRVLCRCDFNVPLDGKKITDETRLVAALPTIKKLISDGGKVILCSHLGKPKGPDAAFSLEPVAERLSALLGQEVKFAADDTVVGENAKAAVAAMNDGDVILLENTRFRAEETKNGEAFSKDLASICDVFVNDAFGTAHRAHCSNVGVTQFVDTAVVGYLMQKEIDFLGNAVNNPVRPFVAILGGSKVSSKISVINNLLDKVDTLIIGGGMSYTFQKAKGGNVGQSLVEDDYLDYAKEMMEKAEKKGVKMLIPIDTVVTKEFKNDTPFHVVDAGCQADDDMGMDIGPKTCELYKEALADAKTVVWNGPMGVFEFENFAKGTIAVAEELAQIADINIEEHAKAMFQAGSDFGSKTPEEIFYQDFKTFSQDGVEFGVGQLSAMTQEELEQVRDKLLPYLRDVLVERKIEMVFVMLTNIIEETTYLICAGEKADDLVEKAYHVHKEGDYHVLKGVVSRKKQLIPMFMSAMQEQ
mgnify:CR=1 FL=1